MFNPATLFLLVASSLLASTSASLNCTVADAPIPQYACPDATCPQVGEYKLGDIAWIWCAVDDMQQPKYNAPLLPEPSPVYTRLPTPFRWMFLENNNYAPAGPGVFERYQDCWFFEQMWPPGTELLPFCRNATFVPKPPPGPPCLITDVESTYAVHAPSFSIMRKLRQPADPALGTYSLCTSPKPFAPVPDVLCSFDLVCYYSLSTWENVIIVEQ
ncbi:hypothetical protein K504DRAFT_499962 [Pleomassaria siparia CBS 279.74]|uniref:Lytic polysaccharide monooxygenase n=1 Tax=Pleomassaria siparia CBS 279.74 TaxID=1314801 RepID=A0A6G1KEM2_9PLEO|nr:hypothetical protein K504DRAFT_499962 [Pleomassaria siparia CBS 279.74]